MRKWTDATPNRVAGRRRAASVKRDAGRHRHADAPLAPRRRRLCSGRMRALRNAFFLVLCEFVADDIGKSVAVAMHVVVVDPGGMRRAARIGARKKIAPDC
ncbi:hypothetical protein [Lysobacter rhizosphaerae]